MADKGIISVQWKYILPVSKKNINSGIGKKKAKDRHWPKSKTKWQIEDEKIKLQHHIPDQT